MHHHLYFHSMIILVLLNLYCYSSPISYAEQNEQEQTLPSTYSDEQDTMKPSIINKNNKLQYLKILCAIYDDCYNKDQQDYIYTEIKPKRLTSSLFHGIPKFGKRAFSSAFSGIPKFG